MVKGCLLYTKWKEDPSKIFGGGTLFVDNATGFMKSYNQVSPGDADTTRRKELCELAAGKMGMAVKKYHGDNGLYKSKVFEEDLSKWHQEISLSGIGENV